MKRYEGGLFIEKPSKPESLLSATHETKVFVYIDQRSSNTTVNQHIDITELHNHFNFVSQLRADISAFESPLDGPDINHPASRENAKRWPCEFDDEDYEIRLLIFETKTLPGMARVEPHQIGKYVAAVDGARQHWQANPRMTIEQTADLIGPLVAKISDGKSGLNHTNSVAWIRSVIGGTGEYAFIKDAFKSIQYDPEQFGPIQYRLLL